MRVFPPALLRRLGRAALALSLAATPLLLVPAAPAHAQDNGASLTPPMGWSSWSFVRKNPTEANIEAQAKALATSGLLAHGYRYVNVDDFWYQNPATTVDGYGRWLTDPARFPDGMGAVGTYLHGLGEKFGMYLTPGIPVAAYRQNTPIEGTSFHARDIVSNIAGFETNYNYGYGSMYYIDYGKNPAAAQAYLNSWADQLASYGVDFLKIDGVGDGDVADVQHWSQALNQTGRPIHLALSNSLDVNNGSTWRSYANSWRIDGDIECYCSGSSYPLTDWNAVASRFTDAPRWTAFAGPGGWPDLDSVEVGNGADDGLTPDERRTQFTLWAVESADLLLGTDLTNLDAADLGLLTNDEVIAVDQAGHPAHPVDRLTQQQVWSAPMGDGSYTVALFNLSDAPATVTARFPDLGFAGSASVRDLWSHAELGSAAGSFSANLNPHASRLLRVSPAAGSSYTALRYNLVNTAGGGYLGVAGGASGDSAGIVQQGADGGTGQQWQLVPTGDGYYKIVNVNSGKLLNVPGATTAEGTQLVQYHDDGSVNSQWRLAPTGDGSYTVGARSDGLNAAAAAGSTAVVQNAPGGAGQHWKLVPLPQPGTRYKLVNSLSGGRMDVHNDSTADGAGILQWQDNGQADQLWTFAATGSGAYTVGNVNSGRLLNIPGPTTWQGTGLIQYHDDGGANSRWTLADAGPNQVRLVSVYDGQLVDVSGGSLSDGATVLQWPDNGAGNQVWTLVPAA